MEQVLFNNLGKMHWHVFCDHIFIFGLCAFRNIGHAFSIVLSLFVCFNTHVFGMLMDWSLWWWYWNKLNLFPTVVSCSLRLRMRSWLNRQKKSCLMTTKLFSSKAFILSLRNPGLSYCHITPRTPHPPIPFCSPLASLVLIPILRGLTVHITLHGLISLW